MKEASVLLGHVARLAGGGVADGAADITAWIYYEIFKPFSILYRK